jgi:hypothetical protein
MKRFLILMFVIAASLAAFGQTPTKAPTLADTLTWMDNTLNHGARGLVAQSERNKWGYSFEETTDFTYKQCSMTVMTIAPGDTNGDSGGKWKSFDASFELRDIDPTTIRVLPLSSVYMSDCTNPNEARALGDCDSQAQVLFSTQDEKDRIRVDESIRQHSPSDEHSPSADAVHQTWTASHWNFGMHDLAYAKRFAKAFHHAVELCGGKPSTF